MPARKKNYIKLIKNKVGSNFTILKIYNNTNHSRDKRIKIRHNCKKCGYNIFTKTIRYFLTHPICPVCHKIKNQICFNYFKIINYQTSNIPAILKCPKGHIFKQTINEFERYPYCPKCVWVNKTKKFDKKLKGLTNNQYIRVGKFNGIDNKTIILHKKCGYKWNVDPIHIFRGNRCPFCQHRLSETEIFKYKFNKKFSKNWFLMSKITNDQSHIILKHKKCGHKQRTTPHNLFEQGIKCKYCKHIKSVKRRKLRLKQKRLKHQKVSNYKYKGNHKYHLKTSTIKNRINKKYHNKYILLSKYYGIKKTIILKHRICNNKFKIIANDALNYNIKTFLCPYCRKKLLQKKYDYIYYKDFIKQLKNNQMKLLTPYKSRHKNVKIYHKECNRSFYTTPKAFKQRKHKCPYCAASSGEKLIMQYLDLHHIIKWHYGYLLHNSKDNRKRLHLDFKIDQINPIINSKYYKNGIGIEFDGKQHFDPFAFNPKSNNKQKHLIKFHRLQRNDKRKNKYCFNHDIYLIRIPYNRPETKELNKKLLPLIKQPSKSPFRDVVNDLPFTIQLSKIKI